MGVVNKVVVKNVAYDIEDANTKDALSAEVTRAQAEEAAIRKNKAERSDAMQYNTLGVNTYADKAEIYGRSITGTPRTFDFPAATKEKAGVMSAEDKTALDSIPNEIDKIKNGDTIVGQAREIHSRNGKTVSDSFLARTTAGSGTIGDGVASLKSVGGNIVKNLISQTAVTATNSTKIDSGSISIFQRKGNNRFGFTIQTNKVVGHKYYFKCFTLTPIMDEVVFYLDGFALQYLRKSSNAWIFNSVILTCQNATGYTSFNFGEPGSYKNDYGALASMLLIDLTEMFGAGKEPTKEECNRLFGNMDALPQGLTIAKPTEFKSTGFNQFNPENVLDGKAIVDNAIVSGDKKIAVIPCLPCKVGTGENNGYCIHGDFGDDMKVYLTPLNPMEVEGELYMHELTKDATTDTYVPQIKGYMLVEVPTTANLCAHFLWSEDKCERDTYEPYFESKVELPEIPQMSEWGLAGIQSSGTLAADTIDFEKRVYRKKIVKYIFNGSDSEVWRKVGTSTFYNPNLKKINQKDSLKNRCILISYNGLEKKSNGDNAYSVGNEANGVFYITPTSINITELDAWREYLTKNPLELYYELAEPEEYPLPKVDNNYISSDYGVEQFDSVVPCNANNLYYMRSLAGETRNFLDRLYDNTAKTDSKEVADYITNGIEGNKELATNAPNLALRALFVAAGAEYNDTDQIIQKTAPWGEIIQHLPKHYYLNGLGDITEEQMMKIYIYTMDKYSTNNLTNFCRKQYNTDNLVRTNLRSKNCYLDSNDNTILLCSGMNNNIIEVFCVNHTNSIHTCNISYLLEHAIACKAIIGIIEIKTQNANSLKNTPKLEYIKIKSLKNNLNIGDSPLINVSSVLYMIQNAKPTSAITITLHPDAYARLANDADIVEALEAQPLITLVSA